MMEWAFALFLLVVEPSGQWFQCQANRCWIESGGYSDKTSCDRVRADFIGSAERKGLKIISAKVCAERPVRPE
jgi:hypothetical protein